MTATVATEFKSNLKYFIDRATSGESVIVTRSKSKNVVLISEDEYNQLLKIKNNAEYLSKLYCSFEQAKSGHVVVKTMEELEAMSNE